MDLTTNDLFLLVKKKALYKLNENKKPLLPSISLKVKQDLLKQQKKEEENYENYFNKIILLNESNISNFVYNSINPKIVTCFNNLKYLSITNNYLINLDFILRMPDLFYLDVFGNPLEDFSSLNMKNIFGYLRLSVDKFHENKILNLSGLSCVILDIEIKDKINMKLFRINNPNILMINNEVNYYIDRLSNIKRKTTRIKRLDQPDYLIPNKRDINIDLNDIKSSKYLSMNYFDQNLIKLNKNRPGTPHSTWSSGGKSDDGNKEKNSTNNSELLNKIKVEIKDSFLLDIKRYFEEFNQIMDKIKKKIKRSISPSDLSNDNLYLNMEKKRLLLLYQTYMKLSILNDEKKEGNYYSKNVNSVSCNKFTDSIKIYEIKKYFKCININIRFGLIILTTILFYTLNLISMKLSITIIHYILVKYYKFDEHKQIPNIKTFGNFHYLCYYIDNLEDFKYKLKFAEKSQVELYKNILNILDSQKLVLMSNFLKKKKEEDENKNIKILTNDNSSKNKVSSILLFLKEINLDKDIFVLIEFFCDFIKFEKMEQIVINGSFNDEYSSIIEMKEILEQIELEKNNLNGKDLINEKYHKNKLDRIFNKFYFENKKIKEVQNKNFKNFENEKLTPMKFNLLQFITNWNKNYKKSDQISVKSCFTIDKIKIKKNEKKSDDDNYSMKENDKIYSNTKNFGHNICFSEGRKPESKSQNMQNMNININYKYHTINPNKSSHIYNTLNNNLGKDEHDESDVRRTHFNTVYNPIYNKNNHRNRLNIKIADNKIKKINIKSTLNIMTQKEVSINISEKKELVNHKSNTFNQLFKYFTKGNNNNIKKIIPERVKNKNKNKYFNSVESNYIQFPYGSNSREEGKIKIKQIENDTVSINAQKIYNRNKISKSRQNMKICKTYFNNELLVEKYDQKRLYNIISKIMEDKNKKIKK